MNDKFDEHLPDVDEGRRDVLRKLILGAAFVAPVASSFGLGPANAQVPNCLLSNSMERGQSKFGLTQNRGIECRISSEDELPEGLQEPDALERFPRRDKLFDK